MFTPRDQLASVSRVRPALEPTLPRQQQDEWTRETSIDTAHGEPGSGLPGSGSESDAHEDEDEADEREDDGVDGLALAELLSDLEDVDGNTDDSAASELGTGLELAESDDSTEDHEEASKLEVGSVLDALPEDEATDDRTPELAELGLDTVPGQDGPGREGPGQDGPGRGGPDRDGPEAAHGQTPSDDAEGVEESLSSMLDEPLPPLDDDAVEEGFALDTRQSPSLGELPPEATVVDHCADWTPLVASEPIPECSTLLLEGAGVLAAGKQVLSVSAELRAAHRLGPLSQSITAALRWGSTEDGLLCITRAGKLLLVEVAERRATPLDEWPSGTGLRAEETLAVQLGSSPSAVFVRLGSGGLLMRPAHEDAWTQVDLGQVVVALSAGSPLLALTASGGRLHLHRFGDDDLAWHALAAAPALSVESADGLLLAAAEEVIAVASVDGALCVSTDAGRSFGAPTTLGEVTALCCGVLEGRPTVFAAVSHPTTGRSQVLAVSADQAVSLVGEVRVTETDDAAEPYRVEALCWAPESRRLWAAGPFGVRAWIRLAG